MKNIKFNNKILRENHCFIIAEAGVNHNGDKNIAKKLIDMAKYSGADAIKFQTFKAENLVTKSAGMAKYQKVNIGHEESQFNMLKKLELSYDDFKELYGYATDKGIIFLSSPFDEDSVDYLDKIGVKAFKIPSGEITNLPLLKRVAKKNKLIIMSTGMATLGEIEFAVNVIKREGNENIILLHCTTDYPVKYTDVNLNMINTLKATFKLPVGFSDHTLGIVIPIAAVTMGACIIEKHITIDKNLPGPDHKASLSPNELIEMVKSIRIVEKSMGNGLKTITKNEEDIMKSVRKSIVLKRDAPKGSVIIEDMIEVKRPGTGIEPLYLEYIIGKKIRCNLRKGDVLKWEMLN